MQKQAASELMLMNIYKVQLPPIDQPTADDVSTSHHPSEELLQSSNPWLLSRYIPVDVTGDGNCFFRSVSYALYRTEEWHSLLRLYCVLEVLDNRPLYDNGHADFYAPYKADVGIVLPDYVSFVSSLVQMNTYCDMLAVLAVSSVCQKGIQTLWPIQVQPGQLSPLTKLVIGRGLTMCRRPLNVMWTVAAYNSGQPHINHFVPLIERRFVGEVNVDCVDAYEIDSVHSTETTTTCSQSQTGPSITEPDCQQTGTPLPYDKNLSLADSLKVLDAAFNESIVEAIPSGMKCNVYFIVSCADNNKRLANGQRRVFYDDCGAWAHTRGYNSIVVGDNPKELYEKDGAVCDRKRINGKDHLVPIEPQPDPASVRKVSRYYYKLKRCSTYTKRITLVSDKSVYLCEYVGMFPDNVDCHGNSKHSGSEYVRTCPDVLDAVKDKCEKQTKMKPSQIYSELTANEADESACPRNLKQVQNVSVQLMSNLIASNNHGTNNLADKMKTLCSQVAQNEFVRHVSFTSGHAPCVVLFTDEQLNDVKRFCGSKSSDVIRSVLCVDRTFNVSSLFLTVTVFKNNSVLRANTMQPPVFLGPVFLHGDGTFVTYLTCFMILRGFLDTELQASELKVVDGMVTGSDEEKALVKALHTAFPTSSHLFCMIHCQDNVRDYLSKSGVALDVREKVLRLLFGADSVAVSHCAAVFEDRRAATLQCVRQCCPSVEDYISSHTLPKILNNCEILWKAPWLGPHRWTNNASESANKTIKLALDWKPARITDLVSHLHDIVKVQYRSVQRAMIGQGDLVVANQFEHHRIPYCRWRNMSEKEQTEKYNAFLVDSGAKSCAKQNTVVSSDGTLTITGTNRIARKPGQRKRPRSERTTAKKTT